MAFSPIFSIRCLDAVLAELYNQLILILLKKVTIQGARGGSPRRPGRAGKPAGRWGSYTYTAGVRGAPPKGHQPPTLSAQPPGVNLCEPE